MSEIGKALNQVLTGGGDGPAVTALADAVKAVATGQATATRDMLGLVTGQMERLQASKDGNTAQATGIASALVESIAPVTASLASTSTDSGSGFVKTLLSSLILSPVISGLLRLFGGGNDEPEGEPIAYTEPDAIRFVGTAAQGAGSALAGIDYGQDGLPRLMNAGGSAVNVDGSVTDATATQGATARRAGGEGGGSGWPGTITVNVQAIDSRSFLDHSDAIANAVREAILNAHPLGEVVREI